MDYDNNEIHAVKLKTRFRLFYFDLKKSPQGLFVKVSEKSAKAGRSTIMFDSEDIDDVIATLQEIKAKAESEGAPTSRQDREEEASSTPTITTDTTDEELGL